jgi:hypothetical protein
MCGVSRTSAEMGARVVKASGRRAGLIDELKDVDT